MTTAARLPYAHQVADNSIPINCEMRTVPVYCMRWNDTGNGEWFNIHHAATGEILGGGENKRHACDDAEYHMMDRARTAYNWSQNEAAA